MVGGMEHDATDLDLSARLEALGIDEATRNALIANAAVELDRVEALDAAVSLATRLAARGAVDDPEEAAALIRGVVECELAARRTMPSGIHRSDVAKMVVAATEYPPPAERPTADHHVLWITIGGAILGAFGVLLQIV